MVWRSKRERAAHGFFAGANVSSGKYDLELHKKGYQGEFISGALTGGYAHTINKSGTLRMEYSVEFGVMKSDYRYYEEHWGIDDTWHTLRQYNGNYIYFGLTDIGVSLVWVPKLKFGKEVRYE